MLAVIGPSGSGKSTLLRSINLLEVPDDGTIHLAGEEIHYKLSGWHGAPRVHLPSFEHR
ncbi:MAG: ATP-binding cassette domain-containing protein [Albidovulum sp.]|nr:ATP-binding cassette domain-containing protein [Albidovulum sp.]